MREWEREREIERVCVPLITTMANSNINPYFWMSTLWTLTTTLLISVSAFSHGLSISPLPSSPSHPTSPSSPSSSPSPISGTVRIKCSETLMEVTIDRTKSDQNVTLYLDKLKGYPGCQPEHLAERTIFRLPLDENFYSCGTTRIQNKLKDVQIFYNRLILEKPDGTKEIVVPKCVLRNDLASRLARARRQTGNDWELAENFTESVEELIDYSGNITEHAPIPYLNIGVRQNGKFVDTALNVHPGTPLEMVIYLDDVSAPIYGLLARYMKVTDNTPRKQEETIIAEGCSIDPYIFSNFESGDGGDSIVAKFRAFKFPESNYVLFVGTVNVCLKECSGVICGNNQVGFGRRRRSIINHSQDPNRIFEIEMSAFLKVDSLEMDGGEIIKGGSGQSEPEKPLDTQDDSKPETILTSNRYDTRSLSLLRPSKTERRTKSLTNPQLDPSSSAHQLTAPLTILISTSLPIVILTIISSSISQRL